VVLLNTFCNAKVLIWWKKRRKNARSFIEEVWATYTC